MGLDMYLYRREYVSDWDFKLEDENPKEREMYRSIVEYMGVDKLPYSPTAQIELCVAYWRKANAIHGWFVNTLADGVDECQPINVDREDLQSLHRACNNVLMAPAGIKVEDVAATYGLLPTRGFFFGSYEIDDWYMDDLKLTMTQIESVLATVPDDRFTDFVYQASW